MIDLRQFFSRISLVFGLLGMGAISVIGQQRVQWIPSFETIGINVQFARTTSSDAPISVSYREADSNEDFQQGHALSPIADNRFAGSLFDLIPDTDYEIRLQSVSFADDVLRVVRTRSEELPSASGRAYYVSASDGDDANHGRSPSVAFATLQRALSIVGPGNRIILTDGIYYEGDLTITKSGTEEAPILIEAAEGATVFLDGSEPAFRPRWRAVDTSLGLYRTSLTEQPEKAYLDGEHFFRHRSLDDLRSLRWGQPGFFADGTNIYVRVPGDGRPDAHLLTIPRYSTGLTFVRASHWQLKNIGFRYFGKTAFHRGIYLDRSDHVLIDGCSFDHNVVGVGVRRGADYNIIQNCTFNDSPLPDWNWNAIKSGVASYEGGGYFVYGGNEPNIGNVVRRNRFVDQFDAAHVMSTDASGPTENFDFYDNEIINMGDDGLETDGAGVNVRIFRNRFDGFLTGISVAPAHLGPTFVYRNLLLNWRSSGEFTGYPIKLNSDSDLNTRHVFLYHNTCFTDVPGQDGFLIRRYSGWSDVVSRNNIYAGTDYALESVSSVHPMSLDYDWFYTSNPSRFIRWQGRSFRDLSSFTEVSGQLSQGVTGVSSVAAVLGEDYSPRSGGALIDRGVVIPGINNDFAGEAPDIGAIESRSGETAGDLFASIQSASVSDGQIVVEFQGRPGESYLVEGASELMPGVRWRVVGTERVATEEGLVLFSVDLISDARFFRARRVF
jgi:hypothetical protein